MWSHFLTEKIDGWHKPGNPPLVIQRNYVCFSEKGKDIFFSPWSLYAGQMFLGNMTGWVNHAQYSCEIMARLKYK